MPGPFWLSGQLLPQRRQGGFLTEADGHAAETQLPAYRPLRLALQHPQAQNHGLVRRKALQQGVSGNAEAFGGGLFAFGGGEGVKIGGFAWAEGIEALVPQRMNALLVLAARNSHQAAVTLTP